MYRIFLVEDDHALAEELKKHIERSGHEVCVVNDFHRVSEECLACDPHLVLMDIMMPVMDGITATARLREKYNIPVIFLSAKSEDADKILGLNVGADDYITKPFNPTEVIARIRSQLRRYTKLGGKTEESSELKIGGIVMDDERKIVTVDGNETAMTPMEYGILRLLMKNPGRVFSSKEIYTEVWKDQPIGSEGVIAVHIRHLREKVEINPSEPRYIKVVWGQGYKMEAQGGKR